ncbi:MAG: CHAT domain-containing protein [Acidobacteria bacterium]|nr:CHAT domain-containing protein [Acidobacteriota bacterium]
MNIEREANRPLMGRLPPQPAGSDEAFAEHLIALAESDEFIRTLHSRRERINRSVLRHLKDKVSHLARTDTEQAKKVAAVTRAVAELTDDPICQALSCHACAQAMHVSGRYAHAIEFYDQAEAIYDRVGEEVEAARIARAKVNALMYLGRYEEALLVAAKARKVFQRHGEAALLAQLELNVGNIYHRLDEYREALRFYGLAEGTFAAQQDEFGLTQVRFNKANQYTQLNQFEKALGLYEQANQGYEKLNMPILVNQTDYSVAWLYFLRGRFQESLKLFAEVQVKAKELGDDSLSALCDLDRAEVYLQLNMLEDALQSARSAAEKFRHLEMNYEYAKANMYLGIAYTQMSDFATAEQRLQEAREGFLAEGNEVYAALADIYLSDVFTHWNDSDQAMQLCAEAKMLLGERNLSAKVAYAELQEARLKLLAGDLDEAGALCRSALGLLGETEAPWLRYQILHLLGNAEQQAGHQQEAYQHYNKAIEYLEAMRSSIRADEYKCAFMKDKLRVYEDLVDLCLQVGTQAKIDEAFTYVEAAKSRSLTELLATDRSIKSKADEPTIAQLHQQWNQLREELDYYYNRINQHESRPEQRPTRLGAELHEGVREREQRLAQLARRLSLEDAEYASLHTTPRVSAQQVRQHLAENEALIEYFIVNGQVKVFALSHETVRVYNNITTVDATASLLQWLKFYLDQFTMSDHYGPAQLDSIGALTHQYLEGLYAALVAPIESFLQGKKIIIAPHGILHYVPFHALHDGHEYLIDRHEISYCPSASSYQLCLEKAQRQRANGPVLIIGVPDQAAPLIREEVATVKSLWPEAQVLLGEEATLDQLKQKASACGLLHLASHGVFRRDNPMFSALKLSDSWLNLYDIFNLNLNANLVTLSACETGMNEIFPGDELFGLMRGFLYAGAPSLIVSLWVVNDRSTAEFMRWLYAGLREGLTKRAALRQAQLTVKQEYKHPYYWAPFILMGAPS